MDPVQNALHPEVVPARAPALTPGEPSDRLLPFEELVDDWPQLFSFQSTAVTTAQESAFSRVLYGPFRLDWVMASVSGQSVANNRVTTGVSYSDGITTVEAEILGNIGAGAGGDLQDLGQNIQAQGAGVIVPVGTVIRHGVTRLVYAYRNLTAGTVTVWVQMHVTHLRERQAFDRRVY